MVSYRHNIHAIHTLAVVSKKRGSGTEQKNAGFGVLQMTIIEGLLGNFLTYATNFILQQILPER
jgi:hypothetical protein